MPRRSTGCELCRKRKIRCDERKPQCQKCIDYGVVCPGYRPPAGKELHFVDQTRHIVRQRGNEGSQLPHQTNEHAVKQYKWRHEYYGAAKPLDPDNINKRHIHRVQLLSTFLDLYLPRKYDKASTSSFEYIKELPQMDISSALLQNSIEALCLAELGSLYQDGRCLHESQARYVRALPMLANELARPPAKRIRSDHILAAIAVLTLCELFDAIARGSGIVQGWISHVNGAQQFVKAMGPDVANSRFGWLLFLNTRHSSLCMGIMKREAVVFAEPQWLKLTADIAQHDQFVALYDIALQIPGVLEKVDKLKTHPGNPAKDVISVCAEICRLCNELHNWLYKFYTARSVECYNIVDVRDMKEFAKLCLNRTFQTVFSFESTQSCNQQQLYWTTCLMLDFTLLTVCGRHVAPSSSPPVRLKDLTSRSEAEIEKDMFIAATSFCRSVPFGCEPETGSVGRMGTFLLRIVHSYFEQSGHCRESEWCAAVRQALQSYPQSPVDIKESNDVPGAPWNAKHRCKAPICNFRVECVAPAPLLLGGEYPHNEHISPHDSSELVFVHTTPSTVENAIQADETIANQNRVDLTMREQPHPKAGRFVLPSAVWKANGASVLADERVAIQQFEHSIAV